MTAESEAGTDRDRAVGHAMAELEELLALATGATRSADPETGAQKQLLMLIGVDRALAEYLERLRPARAALLRELHHGGATLATLAAELGVSRNRAWSLMNDNQTFLTKDRELALEAFREQRAAARVERAAEREAAREAKRAQVRAERATARERAAADRLAARVEQGRLLAARLAGGETREQLMEETGYSRNRIVGLVTAAREADKVEP
ncbi:MAG: hypothetical protein ACOH17_14195 [Cellulomonas sp.]